RQGRDSPSRFFFFFQAEDGIRDFHVTGVQTCALPILPPLSHAFRLGLGQRRAEPAPTGTAGADLSRLRRRGDRAVLPDPPAGRLLSPPARPPSRSLPGLA